MKAKPIAAICFCLFICIATSGCTKPLSDEEKAQLEKDRPIAEQSAYAYLQSKYGDDYSDLKIEPQISASTANFENHYYGTWEGTFKAKDKEYEIRGGLEPQDYCDTRQYEEILLAYQAFTDEYFAQIRAKHNVNVKAMVLENGIIYGEKDRVRHIRTLYNGNNIAEVMAETGLGIEIDEAAALDKAELWKDLRNAFRKYANEYGTKLLICDVEQFRIFESSNSVVFRDVEKDALVDYDFDAFE
ncbi:MAG: hypothetical protein IJR47_02320 [Clostridia bacterium]|nr:hypothetical protein [Clostridia bacterium]